MATWKRYSIISLPVWVFLLLCALPADAYQLYRYLDGRGKEIYVQRLEDVPDEFRLSASAVRIVEKGGTEVEEDKGKAEEKGEAVRMSRPLKIEGDKEGKGKFTGEAKNYSDAKVTDAKLSVEVLMTTGETSAPITYLLPGKEGQGVLGSAETVQVSVPSGAPMAKMKGFSYNLSWQITTMVPPGAGESVKGKEKPEGAGK